MSFISQQLSFIIWLTFLSLFFSCTTQNSSNQNSNNSTNKPALIADKFAYPVGKQEFLTEAKDSKDDWYNATDFGENNHLGEDWNKNSGGNTDCGEPVYAIGNGIITYAKDAGTGWGNVVIIEHTLPDGKKIQSLYGHLQEILKCEGEIKKREQIGTIGNANGKYLCHLHLEIRDETCLSWNQSGVGYSSERNGWLDPSEFIDKYR
jgi:murein DD-endopeptidase MepM/ murein hydrolase activator NlpD